MTQADVIAASGGDFEAVVEGRAYEIELAQQNGLVFDTDPASVAKNGAAQSGDQIAVNEQAIQNTA
jgi:capsid protein